MKKYLIIVCILTMPFLEADVSLNTLFEGVEILQESVERPVISKKKIILYDAEQSRTIPVAIYRRQESQDAIAAKTTQLPVVIISHGYGVRNTEYTFIANTLATQGYCVLSVQHDLDEDPCLPRKGNIYQKRMPFWERGVKSLKFVMSSISDSNPELNMDKVILIGHSNGGDISMMFADQYPKQVEKVISLDSLRYPFPNDADVLSFRAYDTIADEGVLPSRGAKIINMENAKHIDMYDLGPDRIKTQIIEHIAKHLKGCSQ